MSVKSVLAVSLNSAWQKTLNFSSLEVGGVNRAYECHEAGGGKGVNVARVFRQLGLPVAVAAFVGGHTGECLLREFSESGVEALAIDTAGTLRCCYTVIDRANGDATELIEPSMAIQPSEVEAMMALLERRMGDYRAVALCGSLPPGVPKDIYGRIAALAEAQCVPVVVDAVKGIESVLEHKITLLKINFAELKQITGCSAMEDGAAELLEKHRNLEWLAVTNGASPAGIFRKGKGWRIILQRLEKIVSPIGGGDCTTAMMLRHISTGVLDEEKMVEAFAFALACASASCLTDTPSLFDMSVAKSLSTHVEAL